MARRGAAKFSPGTAAAGALSLAGHTLHQLQVEGRMIARWFLQVDTQPEIGEEAYDAGAKILQDFFQKCSRISRSGPGPLGKQIVNCFLDGGKLEDYDELIPGV